MRMTQEQRLHKELIEYVEAYLDLKKKSDKDPSLWGDKDSKIISEYMSQMGRRGGLKRVSKGIGKLTPEQRKEMGQKAAAARWGTKEKRVTSQD
jgi:hypothetical protein